MVNPMQTAINLIKEFEPSYDDKHLERKLIEISMELDSLLRTKLSANQYSAMLSLIEDIGIQSFADSTMLIQLNKNNYVMAATQFSNYAKIERVNSIRKIRRRTAEKELFKEL